MRDTDVLRLLTTLRTLTLTAHMAYSNSAYAFVSSLPYVVLRPRHSTTTTHNNTQQVHTAKPHHSNLTELNVLGCDRGSDVDEEVVPHLLTAPSLRRLQLAVKWWPSVGLTRNLLMSGRKWEFLRVWSPAENIF